MGSHIKKPLKVIPGLSVEAPTEILTVDLEQASPMKNHEKQLSLVVSKKPIDREGHGQNFYKSQLDGFMNSACCRLLIFWSVITTLSSVVSIYYAIDAQSRLTEAHDRLLFGETNSTNSSDIDESRLLPRFHDLGTRFSGFVQSAQTARRDKHKKHKSGHHRHNK